MSVRQLSLWENVALENGYRRLAILNFEEAISQFNEALKGPGEKTTIQKTIETAQFWQGRIKPSTKSLSSDGIKNLLKEFTAYPFLPQLSRFKEVLLIYITDLIYKEGCKDLHLVKTTFDQLILLKVFQKAEDLILYALEHHPKKHELLYFLAQVQWLKGIQAEANGNYLRALLYYPDVNYFDRIENKQLKALTEIHTPGMVPSFAWVEGILSFITLKDEIKPFNELHEKGIKCYSLLQKAEETFKKDDIKSSVQCRGELKSIAPDLYQKYFDLLQQRKGIFIAVDNSQ
jgi:tetratricopeptide (TPR) repeat protein